MIENNLAVNMEYVAHPTFDTEAGYLGTVRGQPAARPDQDIVSQGFQLNEHLLGLEAFLVAPGSTQSLLVLFDFDLHATTSLITEVHVGQQHDLGII